MLRGTGKLAVLFFIGAAVIGAYYFGFQVGKSEARIIPIEGVQNTQFGAPEAVDFSLFWNAWNTIQEKYAATDPFDYQEMVYGAISGMVESLGDPYTIFMDPEDTKRFRDDISGSFEGVGMEIGIRNRELQVISPLEGTPAKAAGLRPGDIIVRIDDAFTRNIAIEEAVSLIRGPRGTDVTLSILRSDWSETPSSLAIWDRAVGVLPDQAHGLGAELDRGETMATGGEKPWPPVGRFDGRRWGETDGP